MLIALDWDKTYTLDPELWDAFIVNAQQRGHTVKIVTMRYPHEILQDAPVEVLYTSRGAKAKTISPDVWIDDQPHWIVNDSL